MKLFFTLFLCLFFIKTYSQNTDSLLCSQISYRYDDFEHTKKYSTPMEVSSGYTVHFSKEIHKGVSTYYLYLVEEDITPTFGKGVTILLKNNHRISKPMAEVSTDAVSGSYSVSAFIRLNAVDISLLKKYSIIKFRLYIGDSKIDDGDKYKTLFNCLILKR